MRGEERRVYIWMLEEKKFRLRLRIAMHGERNKTERRNFSPWKRNSRCEKTYYFGNTKFFASVSFSESERERLFKIENATEK